MQTDTLLDWPTDAVMIVAANQGEDRRERMESVVRAECRDCQAALAADSFTIQRAERFAAGHRPVKFFCVKCSANYSLALVDSVEDHRDALTRLLVGGS